MLAAVPAVSVPERPGKLQADAQAVQLQSVEEAFRHSGVERALEAGDALVRAGDPKTHVYRIEAGLVCAYWQHSQRARSAVGFSFAGEIVGLGALDTHVLTIEAGAATVVQCLPRSCLDNLLAADDSLAVRHAAATHAEMEFLKESLVAQGRAHTLERVAALLTVLASNNVSEGRVADVIKDDITCGFVAGQLGLDIPVLEEALVGLGRLGLVEPAADGALRLRDRAALERVAEGRY